MYYLYFFFLIEHLSLFALFILNVKLTQKIIRCIYYKSIILYKTFNNE